jgi:hypothetical protein
VLWNGLEGAPVVQDSLEQLSSIVVDRRHHATPSMLVSRLPPTPLVRDSAPHYVGHTRGALQEFSAKTVRPPVPYRAATGHTTRALATLHPRACVGRPDGFWAALGQTAGYCADRARPGACAVCAGPHTWIRSSGRVSKLNSFYLFQNCLN